MNKRVIRQGLTALHTCGLYEEVGSACVLLDAGADMHVRDVKGRSEHIYICN
jgi:hypothetical protein